MFIKQLEIKYVLRLKNQVKLKIFLHLLKRKQFSVSQQIQSMNNIKVVELNGKQYTIFLSFKTQQSISGDVYLAQCIQTKQQFSVKMIPKLKGKVNSYIYSAIVNQALMIKNLNHQNIVQVKQVIQTSNNIYVIQEQCDSNLNKLINNSIFNQLDAIKTIKQISKGRLYLLQSGIMLNQLNPNKILIKNNQFKIRLFTNLKNSKCLSEKDQYFSNDSFYLPIETAKYGISTQKQDIWSIGMIFYQLLHGTLPFNIKSSTQFYERLQESPINIKSGNISKASVDFLQKTLVVKQKNRIDWKQFFSHDIFTQQFTKQGIHRIYEDKRKMVMQKLKSIIEVNGFNLNRILSTFGFTNPNQQISFSAYFKFLQKIEPFITQNEALYMFKKTDIDNSNSISVKQVEAMFQNYGVKFASSAKQIPMFKRIIPEQLQHSERISKQAQDKVKSLFTKLYKIVEGDSQEFQKLFLVFSTEQKIDFKAFIGIVRKVEGNISVDEAEQVFKLIDEDNSKMIEFIQFENFYYRANGLPPKIRILAPGGMSKIPLK